jgi:4-hydroxybenzoate polyprenyltransferase
MGMGDPVPVAPGRPAPDRPRPRPSTSATATLLRAAHPLPAAAVTIFTTALAAAAGNPASTCATVAIAVGAGQLSIGWSNDRLDVERDLQVGRHDKPLATGELSARTVDTAIAAAVLVTVATSFALGWRVALVHLLAVGCGWLYNGRLKATWLSWLPYAVAFGALPAIATLALPAHSAPAWWAVVAGALLGVTAHLTNVLPDLEDDAQTGVAGFPHRIGARSSLLLACATSVAASAVLVLGPANSPSPARAAGLGLAAVWAVAGAVLAWRRPDTRWAFLGTIAVAALDVVLLVLGPSFAT